MYDLAYETLEDKLDTLRLIAQLPKPFRLRVFSVIYYPGTALHTLAVQDGLVVDERDEIYDRMFSSAMTATRTRCCSWPGQAAFHRRCSSDRPPCRVGDDLRLRAPAGRVAKVALDSFKARRNPLWSAASARSRPASRA